MGVTSKRRRAHSWRVRAAAVGLVAGFSLLFAHAGQHVEGVSESEIVLGLEGDAGSFSVDEENLGMRLVMTVVNDAGGIHGRRLVERSYPRGEVEPRAQAVRNARRLIREDDVFGLFNFGGPSSVEVGRLAMEHRVPHLFPHTALLTADGARYVFTSFPRYPGESMAMLSYLVRSRGAKSVGVAHDPNVYGMYFVDRVQELAGELGYRVAGNEPITASDSEDLSAVVQQLMRLKEAGADAVVLALYPAQARLVVRARALLGWEEVTFVSSGPLTDEQYLNVEGDPAEGTLGFCHYPDPERSSAPGVVEYRRQMATHHPGHPLNRYSLYGYVFGLLVVEGLRQAGPELSRERFLDAMESIREWDSGGILPPVSFDSDDHHAQTAGFICELRDGRFEALTGWVEH